MVSHSTAQPPPLETYHDVLLELGHLVLAGVSVVSSQEVREVAGKEGIELHEEVVDCHVQV